MGGKSFAAPLQDAGLAEMHKLHSMSEVNVRSIPVARSLLPLPQRQGPCDLAEGRVQYGFSDNKKFARTGDLVTPAPSPLRDKLCRRPCQCLFASWNARSAEMNNETMASRALAHCKTTRDIVEVAAHYSHAPWYMRFYFQPSFA